MDISVIICTYNRCESLARTLESIYAMQVPGSIRWELLVVDNNSRDGTQETVEGFRRRRNADTPPIYLLETRQGLSHARNRGIREAQGNIIAFTDDDVKLDTNWLTHICREFSRNDAACVGGRILPIWEGTKPEWLGEDLYHHIALLNLGDERIRLSSPTVWGANLSYKAEIFRKYGLFDTSIGHTGGKLYGGEEVEFNRKLLKAGERIVYCPDILVQHHISRSRMERSYFRKWSFDKGELKGIQQGDYPKRNLYGIPLYMVRQLPGDILRSCVRQLRNSESRLREQMELATRFGYFAGRFKYTRAVNRSGGGLLAGPPDSQAMMQSRRNTDSLLVIAPRVPVFDRQSGDLRLYSLLKILSRHYRIHFVAQEVKNDLPQGGQEKYENALKELGITVYVRDFSLREILGKTRFRAAWIEFFFVAEYFLPRLRILQPKCRLIIDTVDVHFARLHSKWVVSRDPKDLKRAEETKSRELAIYRKADSLIMITEEDREVLRRDGVEVPCFLIPNIHDVVPRGSGSVNAHSLVFVGGFAHEPNTDAVLFFCREVFPLIRAKVPDATFTVIGSDPPEAIRALQSDSVRVTGHVPSTTPYLLESRISVAPLRFGAGMKGKIGEAMAHGLPIVTTSVGASGMYLSNRENAMIADTAEDFADSVVELLRDRDLHERIRGNALDHVRKNFSTSRVEKHLLQVLGSLDGISRNPLRLSEKVSFLMDYFRGRVRAGPRGRPGTPR